MNFDFDFGIVKVGPISVGHWLIVTIMILEIKFEFCKTESWHEEQFMNNRFIVPFKCFLFEKLCWWTRSSFRSIFMAAVQYQSRSVTWEGSFRQSENENSIYFFKERGLEKTSGIIMLLLRLLPPSCLLLILSLRLVQFPLRWGLHLSKFSWYWLDW